MADYVAKLVKGTQTLDLASGRYELSPDFVPPSTAFASNISTGTSANVSGKGKLVSRVARPRGLTLPVIIRGSSSAEVEKATADLEYMLSLAGDENEPLYFVWRPHDNYSFEPLLGTHDAYKRFEILAADDRSKWDTYGIATLRAARSQYEIGLTINPFATCKHQRVGGAVGGIFEDYIGQADGKSRGLMIPEATTNEMTNPVFSHATWNNNWAASAATLLDIQNIDKQFVLFGKSSARLVNQAAGERTYHQTINVGDTNTYEVSFYAKRAGGGAISTSFAWVEYGGKQTTTYESVGDGWYRLSASVTGVAAGTTTGVRVAANKEMFVDGFQIEEKAFVTPLAYGDMPGCAWSGTVHASTSTRAAARNRWATSSVIGTQGTIRIVWKADKAATSLATSKWLFYEPTSGFGAWYADGTNDWRFTDGTNTVDSDTQEHSSLDVLVFHFVFGPSRLEIYLNGSAIATGTSYTAPDFGTYIYLGATDSPTNQIDGTFMDFEIFDQMMSAAQASDDYDNVRQISDDDQRVGSIPYFWTDDGDNILDNAYDSDSENFGIIGGIPGDVGAETLWNVTLSAGLSTVKTLGLSLFDTSIKLFPYKAAAAKSGWLNYLYEDYDGTGSDSQYSSDEYGSNAWSAAVGSNGNSPFTNAATDPDILREIYGREWCMIGKVSEADNDLRLALSFWNSSLGTITGDHRTITTAATFYFVHSGFLFLAPLPKDPVMDGLTYAGAFIPYPDVLSGTSLSDVDFAMAIPKPLIIFGNSSEANTGTQLIYRSGEERARVATSGGAFAGSTDASGDRDFELLPNRLNYIFNFVSLEGAVNPSAARTTTFTAVYVKPRWSLA